MTALAISILAAIGVGLTAEVIGLWLLGIYEAGERVATE